jgi:WD40 repeat protein
MLASSGFFGDTIKLWRASDGRMIRTFANTNGSSFIFGPMEPVTFLSDGRTVIAIGEGSVIGVWNVADGKLLRTIDVSGSDLALNPDGTLIAVAANNVIKLVRMSDGTVIRSINWTGDFVQRVAFSPDGTTVAGGDRIGVLRTFRVADGAPLLLIQAHNDYINALRYSPDGTRIATGSADHAVKLWDSTSGNPMGTLIGHTAGVNSLAFSPNGAWLASGAADNTVKLWAMPGGALIGTLNQPGRVDSVSVNPGSTRLAVSCQDELREWDVPSQTLVRNLLRASNQISGTTFTPDSTKLVSGSYDGKLSVYDVSTGALLRQMVPGGNIFSVAASTDMAAAGTNTPNVVKLYRLSDGAFLRTLAPGFMAYTYSAAFSPDGATLATGHFSNSVRLWNVADGALIRTLTGQSGAINGVAYASNGSRLAAVSSGGYIHVWDAAGNAIRTMGPVGQALSSVAISPDNQFVLAGGQGGLLQLWRLDNGAFVYGFAGSGAISQVRFTPSGFAFYAGRNDGAFQTMSTLRVYRTSDHALLETYNLETSGFGGNPSGPLTIDVSADGKRFSYGRDDATVVMSYNTLIAAPTSALMTIGQLLQGSFQDLVLADGNSLGARSVITIGPQFPAVQIDIGAHSPLPNPTQLSFQIVTSATVLGVRQEVLMFNAQSGALELVDSRFTTIEDQTARIDLGPNFSRFIDSAGNLKARVQWFGSGLSGLSTGPWQVNVDQAVWAAGL